MGRRRRGSFLVPRLSADLWPRAGGDSWLEWMQNDLEDAVANLVKEKVQAECMDEAKKDIVDAAQTLEKHLIHNTYIVGHHITLADVCAFAALRHVKKAAGGLLAPEKYQSVTRWYSTVEAQMQAGRK